MAPFDDESVCSTESLLKQEYSSIDIEGEQPSSRTPRKGLWARIWQHRLPFLVHLAIITTYTVGFLLMLNKGAKLCEHGPDLVNCESEIPTKFIFCGMLTPYSACSGCREVRETIHQQRCQ